MGFFDFLSGGSQRRDLRNADTRARGEFDEGLTEGRESYETGRGRFDEYEQGGREGFNALTDALGLNGADGSRRYMQGYVEDPSQKWSEQSVARQMAARGLTNSGASRLAAARVWQEGYRDRLNRLTDVGRTGMQAAGAQAQFDQGIGDMEFGAGQWKANRSTDMGNAYAASRNTGINNLLNIAGTAAKFMPWGGTGGGGGR